MVKPKRGIPWQGLHCFEFLAGRLMEYPHETRYPEDRMGPIAIRLHEASAIHETNGPE